MSNELIIALANLAAKVGLDATIAFLQRSQQGSTIDDAIAALEAAKAKTWEQYKQEAIAAGANPLPGPHAVADPTPPTPTAG